MKKFIKTYPLLASMLITIVVGTVGGFIFKLLDGVLNGMRIAGDEVILTLGALGIYSSLFGYPIVLTVLEMAFLYCTVRKSVVKIARRFDQVAFWYGLVLEVLYLSFCKNMTFSDWTVQLSNLETHTPIYTDAIPTVLIIGTLALMGFLYLSFWPMEKMPPLTAVLAIAAMYLGIIELVVFMVQVFWVRPSDDALDLMLLLWPLCIILMSARIVFEKVREWSGLSIEKRKINEKKILRMMDRALMKSELWPVCGLLLAIPLLGIMIAILLLFGQAPDSIVKAWTETADWRLSAKQAPQNIYYDEHYLCTVSAGGHKSIVKPIRKGIRHGHPVIVNRQLCVANAFEQILEEKTPNFHRHLRNFYDHYGFPIAKMIRKRWIADIIYILMKPLEWIFLIVLYMTDLHPENRIAVQYMGRVPEYRK